MISWTMMRVVNIRKYVKSLFATNKAITQHYSDSKGSFNISRVDEFTEKSEDSSESTFKANHTLSKSDKLSQKAQDIEGFTKNQYRHIFENHNIQNHETEKLIEEMKEIIKLQHQEMNRRLEKLENASKLYRH